MERRPKTQNRFAWTFVIIWEQEHNKFFRDSVRFASMILERMFLISTLSFALLLLVGGSTIAQTMQSPLPMPTGYVNDYAAVIDSTTKARMEPTLGNLDREQQTQFAVV